MYYKFLIRKLERSCQGNAVTMLRKHALVYESISAKAEFPNMLLSIHKHDSVYIWLFLFPKCTLICPAITIQLPIGRGGKFFICKISIFILICLILYKYFLFYFIPYISLIFHPFRTVFPNTFDSWLSEQMCYEERCHSSFVVAVSYRNFSIGNFHIV